ncbi:MAG: hypothetical protein VYE69_05070, partial [Pseudomonadota bacterium]|nr:hypothetical protein [Pseudomonadota bacterium]
TVIHAAFHAVFRSLIVSPGMTSVDIEQRLNRRCRSSWSAGFLPHLQSYFCIYGKLFRKIDGNTADYQIHFRNSSSRAGVKRKSVQPEAGDLRAVSPKVFLR